MLLVKGTASLMLKNKRPPIFSRLTWSCHANTFPEVSLSDQKTPPSLFVTCLLVCLKLLIMDSLPSCLFIHHLKDGLWSSLKLNQALFHLRWILWSGSKGLVLGGMTLKTMRGPLPRTSSSEAMHSWGRCFALESSTVLKMVWKTQRWKYKKGKQEVHPINRIHLHPDHQWKRRTS